MTDRELLEWAAKAAGIALWHEDVFTSGLTLKVSPNGIRRWNPLTSDGDALRLAVKLGIADLGNFYDGDEDDPYAATRRAIVCAAAALGQSLAATSSGDSR